MKKRKLLSSLIACLLAFTCIASVATVSASAAVEPEYLDDVDEYGNLIYEYMEDFLFDWCDEFFYSDAQISSNVPTIVLVDDQLLDYGFLDHIIPVLRAHFGPEIDFENIYEYTGIVFYIQHSGYYFYDLELWNTTMPNTVYDFSDENIFASLCSYVGSANMCVLGVWDPGNAFYDIAKTLQDLWYDDLPCYFIYRDPIIIGEDGLIFMVYDSVDNIFYYCDEAPGVIFQ